MHRQEKDTTTCLIFLLLNYSYVVTNLFSIFYWVLQWHVCYTEYSCKQLS